MKITEIERPRNKNQYLYEGLNKSAQRSMMLWEYAGSSLMAAQLTADQINQIFQQVQNDKSNRTAIGRAVDVPKAVFAAYDDLKQRALNSNIMKNFDAIYDQAAEKLKQATGGDQGAMQYVQKYRDFAKKHPIAQGLIYSALIAAAGISGAGLGGAAALGLFKMVDKLLQGEKFSRAAVAGAETGAMAYAAGQIGKAMQGHSAAAGQPAPAQGHSAAQVQTAPAAGDPVQIIQQTVTTPAGEALGNLGRGVTASMRNYIASKYSPENVFFQNDGGTLYILDKLTRQPIESLALFQQLGESYQFTESNMVLLCLKLEKQQMLKEGILDGLKGAAGAVEKGLGAVGSGLGKVGRAFTAKVSSDRLMQAWRAAGKPTDSVAIADILRKEGVGEEVIQTVFQSNNIPYAAPAATPAVATPAVATPAVATPAATPAAAPAEAPAASPAPTPAAAPSTTATMQVGQINKILPTLKTRDLQSLKKFVDTVLAKKGGTTVSAPAPAMTPAPSTSAPSSAAQSAEPSMSDLLRQRRAQGLPESKAQKKIIRHK
jgi:hypothetical protein